MKKYLTKQRSLVLWLVLLTLLLWTASAEAQAPARIGLTTSLIDVRAGETFDVAVEIFDATNVFGYELVLVFDPEQLRVVDADGSQDGIQIIPGSFLDPTRGFVVANQADDAGTVLYALTLLSPASPVDGAGQLATVTFRAMGGGETTIKLKRVLLASRDGTALPMDIGDDVTVRIGDGMTDTAPNSLVSSQLSSPNPGSPTPSTAPVLPSVISWSADHLLVLAICFGAGGLFLLGFGLVSWLRTKRI